MLLIQLLIGLILGQTVTAIFEAIDLVGTYSTPSSDVPMTCQDSYYAGQTASGIRTLSTPSGEMYEAYCLYTDGPNGYIFPDRSAVEFADLDIETISNDQSHVMLLRRNSDGTTDQAILEQLRANEDIPLSILQNNFSGFNSPTSLSTYGPNFLYLGFVNIDEYIARIDDVFGYRSNYYNIHYNHCTGAIRSQANSGMTLYPNINQVSGCSTPSLQFQLFEFFATFTDSPYSVMDNKQFWFTLEGHFGGCGYHYVAASCAGVSGYALGLPFGTNSLWGPPPVYPANCQESYLAGNTYSGAHKLTDHNGDPYEVYCLFTSTTEGYVFPSRLSVATLFKFDLTVLSKASVDHVMVVKRPVDGKPSHSLIRQFFPFGDRSLIYGDTTMGLQGLKASDATINRPFGWKFMYVGFLNATDYFVDPSTPRGFESNGADLTHTICQDDVPYSIIEFFPNFKNGIICNNNNKAVVGALVGSFGPSVLAEEVTSSDDYWFSIDVHMGQCNGFHYTTSPGCREVDGYALGLPFEITPTIQDECDCKPLPKNCRVESRTECMLLVAGRHCGIGQLVEVRTCKVNGEYVGYKVERNCCYKPCPGFGQTRNCTCADVFPDCDPRSDEPIVQYEKDIA